MADSIKKTIHIFILDPYTLIRAGLRLIIENEPGMEVVGEAGDSTTGLEMVARLNPDIILLQLSDAEDLGLDIISHLLEACSHTRIILMTTTDDFQICTQAIERGVLGVVPKTQPPKTLFQAIKKVHDGEVWIERSMMAHFLSNMSLARNATGRDPDTQRILQLSDRERQVIHFIGLGLKNKQIAAQLCISEVTVRHHLTSVYNKLGVSDRLELLVFANRRGLTTPYEDRMK